MGNARTDLNSCLNQLYESRESVIKMQEQKKGTIYVY